MFLRLVHGNTGRGVYDADTAYDAYISLKGIKELSEAFNVTSSPLRIGAGTDFLFLYFLTLRVPKYISMLVYQGRGCFLPPP